MSYTYDQRKRPLGQNETAPVPTDAPGPDLSALMTGAASPSASQKGQPFDLDATIKAKMENAFGDLSAVRFYRSQAVGNAGAEAVARGNEIAFAPGMSDFSTRAGQERLGHVLNSLLLNPKNSDDAYNDWSYSITADKIVQAALKKVMSKEEFKKLKRFKENDSKKEHLRGQLDLKGSNLYKKGHTSRYGQKNATEFFAEAFADVYTHGKNARPASIAVVQEYESRYKEMKEKPDVKGMDLIPDDDPQDVDELNDSMIAHNPDRQKIKRIYGN